MTLAGRMGAVPAWVVTGSGVSAFTAVGAFSTTSTVVSTEKLPLTVPLRVKFPGSSVAPAGIASQVTGISNSVGSAEEPAGA